MTDAGRQSALRLERGVVWTSSRAISEVLQREGHRGCSQSQVKRYLRELRGASATGQRRPGPRPGPSAPTAPRPMCRRTDDERRALEASWYAAGSPEERAVIDLQLLCLAHPEIAAALARGESPILAIGTSSFGHVLTALGTAEAIAELAAYVNEDDLESATDMLARAIAILAARKAA